MKYECPQCSDELRKRAPNLMPNIRRRRIGNPTDRFVCTSCRETFSSHEIEWVGDSEVWFNE